MDPISLGLGALSIGTGVVGAFKSQSTNMKMLNKQLNHADQAATIAYNRQRELIDKINLYNDPRQQMQRYSSAGLNPYLLYETGGGTIASSSANVQQANTPTMSPTPNYYDSISNQVGNMVNNMFNAKRIENETKLAESQAAKNYSDAGLSETQNNYLKESFNLDLEAKEWDNRLKQAQFENINMDSILKEVEADIAKYKKENIKASTEQINAQKDFLLTQKTSQEILNKYLPQQQAADLAEKAARARMFYQQGKLAEAQAELQEFMAETSRIQANAATVNANTNYVNALDGMQKTTNQFKIDKERIKLDKDKNRILEKGLTKFTQKDFGNGVVTIAASVFAGSAKNLTKAIPTKIMGFGN